MKYNEIRTRHGALDDIAIDDLHLEDMDGKNWWLGLYRKVKDKRFKGGWKLIRTSFWIRSKSKIVVEIQENELKSKLVEQEI